MKKSTKILIIFCCIIIICTLSVILLKIVKVGGEDSNVNADTILEESYVETIDKIENDKSIGDLKENSTKDVEETKTYTSDQNEFKVESTD